MSGSGMFWPSPPGSHHRSQIPSGRLRVSASNKLRIFAKLYKIIQKVCIGKLSLPKKRFKSSRLCTLILFVSILSAKFGICTVVVRNRALIEAQLRTSSVPSVSFIFNKCPRPTTVQMPNSALIETKRITEHNFFYLLKYYEIILTEKRQNCWNMFAKETFDHQSQCQL